MLKLSESYKVKGQRGFIYNQLKRDKDVVLSEQIWDEDNTRIGFEVFVVQKYPDRMSPDGKTFIPAKEAVPSSESWGTKGFSYSPSQRERAELRFSELVSKQTESNEN